MASQQQPHQKSGAGSPKWIFPILVVLIAMAGIYYFHKVGGEKSEETENLSPPSIYTGTAAEITETSALLTATISYGDYRSVDVGFRWRERGGTWRYVPWYPNFSGPSCGYRLSALSPGTTYEFQALLRYDGREVLGEVRSFTTLRPGGGMSIIGTIRAVYYPKMTFTAKLTPEQKVLLIVEAGENLQARDWEWRAENEDGPITPFVVGSETLFPGASVLLEVSSLVRSGSLGVGDWIRIRHIPSGFLYRATISS